MELLDLLCKIMSTQLYIEILFDDFNFLASSNGLMVTWPINFNTFAASPKVSICGLFIGVWQYHQVKAGKMVSISSINYELLQNISMGFCIDYLRFNWEIMSLVVSCTNLFYYSLRLTATSAFI